MNAPHLSPQELLQATHEFPGKFVFKAIGRNDDDFIDGVVAVVRSELCQEFDAPYELHRTTSGRHVSVTIEPIVETAEQVLAIFRSLRGVDGLVLLL